MQAGFFVQNAVKIDIASMQWTHVDGTIGPSVDTGRFLNSISVRQTAPQEVEIYTQIPYAKWLEYGTSKMAPREHFTRTARDINKEIKKIIKDECLK